MKKEIKSICKKIEKQYNIKILFAIENGSRNWGIKSKDSDYDIRFVFVRPLDYYLKLNKEKDVILIEKYRPLIDIVGYDIYKALKLLQSSNPQIIEWLNSHIVYYGKQPKELVNFSNKCKKRPLFEHYKSMCKQNYLKYLKSGSLVTYKKYLYSMRGLINAKYVNEFLELPAIKFIETINACEGFVDKYIIDKLKEIIELKKQGEEKNIVQSIVKMDSYIETFLKTEEWKHSREPIIDTRELDKFVLKQLGVAKSKMLN